MANTTYLGLPTVAATVPNAGSEPEAILSNATSAALDAMCAVAVASADGAIATKQGLVAVTKSASAAALTLALPVAGLPSATPAGDDGKKLIIMSTTAKAHAITTPAAGVNGASTTLTLTAAAGNFIELVAYNASWWVRASQGLTIS